MSQRMQNEIDALKEELAAASLRLLELEAKVVKHEESIGRIEHPRLQPGRWGKERK